MMYARMQSAPRGYHAMTRVYPLYTPIVTNPNPSVVAHVHTHRQLVNTAEMISKIGVDNVNPVLNIEKNSIAEQIGVEVGDYIEEIVQIDTNVYEVTVRKGYGDNLKIYMVI